MSDTNARTETQSDISSVIAQLLQATEQLKSGDFSSPPTTDTATALQVEVGSVLWGLADAVNQSLDGIKKNLRGVALSRLGPEPTGTVDFAGTDLGVASVNIPKVSLRIPKGKKIEDIKSALGSDFSLFFEEVVTYTPRPEFDQRVTSLNHPLHQQILLNAVERVEPTPRVSFRRNSPVNTPSTGKDSTALSDT